MAYKTSQLKEQALKVIKEHNLIFIEDIVSFLPCSKPTFYEHKLNELNDIKELLDYNKTQTKVKLRKKWQDSDNATLQLALMRLLCTDKERRKLAINYTEVTGKDGGEIKLTSFNYLIPHSENGSDNKTLAKATPSIPETSGQDN